MDYEHLDFPAAVHKLAARVGIRNRGRTRAAQDETQQHEARRLLLRLHAEAAEWFHENLLKRDVGGAGARLSENSAALSREVAKSWKLGLRAGKLGRVLSMGEQGRLSPAGNCCRAGLVKLRDEERGDGEFYDRFRGRLMFPICNDVGEVIAFSRPRSRNRRDGGEVHQFAGDAALSQRSGPFRTA